MAGHLLLAKILSDISHYTNNILVVMVVLGSQKNQVFPMTVSKEVVCWKKKMKPQLMTWGISFAKTLFSSFKSIIHLFLKYDQWLHSIFLNLLSLQRVSVTTAVGKMMVKVGIGNSSSIVIVFAFSLLFTLDLPGDEIKKILATRGIKKAYELNLR